MMASGRCFFHFFKILVFWVVKGRGVTGKKKDQNEKKFCFTLYLRNCASYNCGFSYTCIKCWYLQQFFSFFQKSYFSGFSEFISGWQKEIVRCAPPSHVCDLLCTLRYLQGKSTLKWNSSAYKNDHLLSDNNMLIL